MNSPSLTNEQRRGLTRELAVLPGGFHVSCAGRSMEPTIRMGDRVRIGAVDRVRPGDVVLFETVARDAYILHRVVLRIPGTSYFVHLGDAGSCGRPGIASLDRVVGRAALARRRAPVAARVAAIRRVARAVARRLRRLAA